MPPISCTSKCRMLSTRRPASRTTANASSRISSSTCSITRAALGFNLLLAVDVLEIGIRFRFVGDRAQPLLNAGAELVCLGAELFVGELLDFWLERVDGGDARLHTLDLALVLRPENLA